MNALGHQPGLKERKLTSAAAQTKRFHCAGFFVARAPAVVKASSGHPAADDGLDAAAAASSPARANSLVSASLYAATVSASDVAFSCSVGLMSSFSMISRVISSTRARASGG